MIYLQMKKAGHMKNNAISTPLCDQLNETVPKQIV